MDVRGFTTNGYRLDLTLKYLNGTEEVYSTKNTYELVNFNINTTDKTTLFSNISSTTQLSENTKLYYIKDDSSNNSDDNEKEDSEITVAKQVECINTKNNRGDYVEGRHYSKGDFAYCDGSWWQLIQDKSNATSPDKSKSRWWKKINKNYSPLSAYTKGDIVFLKKNNVIINAYRICILWELAVIVLMDMRQMDLMESRPIGSILVLKIRLQKMYIIVMIFQQEELIQF